MELIIDNRELAIKKYFEDNKNFENVKYENMDIGDFRIEFNNQLICILKEKLLKILRHLSKMDDIENKNSD